MKETRQTFQGWSSSFNKPSEVLAESLFGSVVPGFLLEGAAWLKAAVGASAIGFALKKVEKPMSAQRPMPLPGGVSVRFQFRRISLTEDGECVC